MNIRLLSVGVVGKKAVVGQVSWSIRFLSDWCQGRKSGCQTGVEEKKLFSDKCGKLLSSKCQGTGGDCLAGVREKKSVI